MPVESVRRAIGVAAGVVLAGGSAQVAALRAAGLNGTAPQGAGAFKQLDFDVDEQLGVADRNRCRAWCWC